MNDDKIYGSRLGEGIDFRYIREDKFKTSCLSVHLVMPIVREDVTVNAVLAGLLKRSCEKYPTFTALRRQLAMLYGANVGAAVSNFGHCQMITLEISMIDDRFIPDGEAISEECAALLCDLLFRPAREADGSFFREEDVKISLRLAQERIQSRLNDKGEYASRRCMAEMCANEPCGIEAGGYEEDLPHITREGLAQAWQKLLSTAAVNIIMVGAAEHSALERRFAEEFGQIRRDFVPLPEAEIVGKAETEREIIERMDVQQCKMVMGMRIPIAEPRDDTFPARLMAMLYGGGANSLLFNNVREKLSLCYYCSSSYLRKNGILMVHSGLEEENYATAVAEIKKQLAVIANNEFTDEEFEAVKRYAINGFEEMKDSIDAIERWYAMQYLDGCVRTPEQAAARYAAVTHREVADCAARVTVDTVYLLAPKQSDNTDTAEGGEAE